MARQESAPIVRAKVILVGAPSVGKTSLIRQFVHSVFSDEYRSTIGVKVDRKIVVIDRATVTMLLWDMHGEAEGLDVPDHYLRGAAGSIAVFDATRPETYETASSLQKRVRRASPNVFPVAVANKSDLCSEDELRDSFSTVSPPELLHATSAKTGDGVDELFHLVATGIRDGMEQRRARS